MPSEGTDPGHTGISDFQPLEPRRLTSRVQTTRLLQVRWKPTRPSEVFYKRGSGGRWFSVQTKSRGFNDELTCPGPVRRAGGAALGPGHAAGKATDGTPAETPAEWGWPGLRCSLTQQACSGTGGAGVRWLTARGPRELAFSGELGSQVGVKQVPGTCCPVSRKT